MNVSAETSLALSYYRFWAQVFRLIEQILDLCVRFTYSCHSIESGGVCAKTGVGR